MSVKIIIEPLAERHLAQAAQLERECFSDPWSLEGLRADPDSFLALERQNPACILESGFLQCAVVLTGERAGWYAVECGYPGPEGPVLLERQVPSIQEVVPVFESVYRQRDAVLSGFADLSDAMGRNESTR